MTLKYIPYLTSEQSIGVTLTCFWEDDKLTMWYFVSTHIIVAHSNQQSSIIFVFPTAWTCILYLLKTCCSFTCQYRLLYEQWPGCLNLTSAKVIKTSYLYPTYIFSCTELFFDDYVCILKLIYWKVQIIVVFFSITNIKEWMYNIPGLRSVFCIVTL